jgi:hypothetical protein
MLSVFKNMRTCDINNVIRHSKILGKKVDKSDNGIKNEVRKNYHTNVNMEHKRSSRSKRVGSIERKEDDADEPRTEKKGKRRARQLSDSSSEGSSSISIDNAIISDSEEVAYQEKNGRARRALSFSEILSSNDVPQRSRSPKRKGNMIRSHDTQETRLNSDLTLPKENGYDKGDESERSIQEERSPKRSTKEKKMNNNPPEQVENTNSLQASKSLMLGSKGTIKRGKPEPMTPRKSPEDKATCEPQPWLLRDIDSSNESSEQKRVNQILKDAFENNEFPSMQELANLEEKTKTPTKKIIYWFQQTRKTKRKESTKKSARLRAFSAQGAAS